MRSNEGHDTDKNVTKVQTHLSSIHMTLIKCHDFENITVKHLHKAAKISYYILK